MGEAPAAEGDREDAHGAEHALLPAELRHRQGREGLRPEDRLGTVRGHEGRGDSGIRQGLRRFQAFEGTGRPRRLMGDEGEGKHAL